MKLLDSRSRIVFCLIAAVCIIPFAFHLISYSAVIPGLDSEADRIKEAIIEEATREATIEGSIVDTNGDVITYATEPGTEGNCVYLAYSQLVGYNNEIYSSYGLRGTFADALYTGDRNNVGSTLKLTTINELQCAAYDTIRGTNGAVVVLENKTGRILALATASARVEMDVNDLASNWSEMMSTNDGFLYPNWEVGYAPGSVMKVVTAAMICEKDKQDYVYNDVGAETIAGYTFHNAGDAAYGNVSLERAVEKSINTYFAHMTDRLGSFNFQQTCEAFCIGQTIELDFTTINSEHSIEDCSSTELAAAGFGQGRLILTPLNMAMIGQAIANDGVMLKPYLIDSISNASGQSYEGKTEELSVCCSKESAQIVAQAMHTAAISYGIDESRGICAKTGTAEVGNSYRASFLSFNEKYTVVIVENNTGKAGKNLANAAMKLYDILEGIE